MDDGGGLPQEDRGDQRHQGRSLHRVRLRAGGDSSAGDSLFRPDSSGLLHLRSPPVRARLDHGHCVVDRGLSQSDNGLHLRHHVRAGSRLCGPRGESLYRGAQQRQERRRRAGRRLETPGPADALRGHYHDHDFSFSGHFRFSGVLPVRTHRRPGCARLPGRGLHGLPPPGCYSGQDLEGEAHGQAFCRRGHIPCIRYAATLGGSCTALPRGGPGAGPRCCPG